MVLSTRGTNGSSTSGEFPVAQTSVGRHIARVLALQGDDVAAAWLTSAGDRLRQHLPELERSVRSLVRGLHDVFTGRGWSLAQNVIDGLAAQRAQKGLGLELRVQRALLAGRRAIRPYCDTKEEADACEEAFLEVLHECLFRFTESFQGLRLATESERLHLRIIKSLVMALEARDAYTKGHSISVAMLAQRIAEDMGDLEPNRVYLAGLLHDVGKVGVPDHILLKAGPLDDHEWALMKSHSETGANILRPINLYPEVVDGAFTHHENVDGSGYPNGLVGDEIPLIGRILRVADAFDAMISSRVYRPSRSIEEAMRIIDLEAGTSFDERVVESFMGIVDSPEAMRDLSMASLVIDMGDFELSEVG